MLPYKVPSEFIVLENLPLTPAKKVDRVALKDRLVWITLLKCELRLCRYQSEMFFHIYISSTH